MKLVSAFAAALLLIACAGADAEDAPPRQDAALLTACISAALPQGGMVAISDPRACIGQISRACHDAMGDGGDTTAGMVACAVRERDAWGEVLHQSAESLRQNESQTQRAALAQMLEQGEAWMLARCGYAASIYEGGSLARVVAAQCQRDTMAERAIDLQLRLREGAL